MSKTEPFLLAYYGDDFTGSTDALEFLSRSGIKTVLFVAPPSKEQLARYHGIQAFGVAGMTRVMPPKAMELELKPAFEALKASGARQVHYKVCSTFDSSPEIGSIGKAMEVGAEVFGNRFISLLVAAPALGRYCAFGNLFARMGIGSQGEIYRLDRHPSASRHPVTPSDESDLRLHLARQTNKKIGLVDILEVDGNEKELKAALEKQLEKGAEVVLFDGLYEHQMPKIGQVLDQEGEEGVHFSVGSSGVEMALGSYWKASGKVKPATSWPNPGKAEPLLVVSGSGSPVTAGQINWALDNGFKGLALDTIKILEEEESADLTPYVDQVVNAMERGASMVLHTALGPDDPRMIQTKELLLSKGFDQLSIGEKTAEIYGGTIGQIVRRVAQKRPFQRLLIAGGDTSSKIARELGIEAVEMLAPLAPGAPLCKAYAPGSPIDGIEVNFKGGQVGAEDYFGKVQEGVMN